MPNVMNVKKCHYVINNRELVQGWPELTSHAWNVFNQASVSQKQKTYMELVDLPCAAD